MNPKNGYEARLAKMAGDENVTIPKPTNAYMKYMDDIEPGGSSGGGGGGGDMFIVHATRNWDDSQNDFVLTIEEAVEDIRAAILAGRYTEMHIAFYDGDPDTNFTVFPLFYVDLRDESATRIDFMEGLTANYSPNNDYVELAYRLISYYEGSWSYQEVIRKAAVYTG